MVQAISTVLAKNESIKLAGPGIIKVKASSSVVLSAIKTNTLAKSSLLASSTLTPLIGLTLLIGGMLMMVKMATDATNQNLKK
ncbi:MAG: hypothetical protein HQL72_09300 [Magnetococcales bacterium]|nr:hypothetical protein [Magnetococcales bacterium]